VGLLVPLLMPQKLFSSFSLRRLLNNNKHITTHTIHHYVMISDLSLARAYHVLWIRQSCDQIRKLSVYGDLSLFSKTIFAYLKVIVVPAIRLNSFSQNPLRECRV
jgi:hypothetical protein